MKYRKQLERVLRPVVNGHHALLSYEIYKDKHNPDEHETVAALNRLTEEEKAKSFFQSDFLWYVAL